MYPFYTCFTCYLSDLISEELKTVWGLQLNEYFLLLILQSVFLLITKMVDFMISFWESALLYSLVWSFKTMTFGNIYFKQNANSQTHIDALTVFHFFTAHFIHLLKRLTKSAAAPSSAANPTAVCPQQRTLLSSTPLIGSSVWAVAPVWVDKEQRTSPGGEKKRLESMLI